MANILIIGGMTAKQFVSKTKSLLKLDYIEKIFLFRNTGNVYKKNKKVLTAPFCSFNSFDTYKSTNNKNIINRIIFDIYNLCYFSYLLLRNKIDVVIGIYLYPYGLYASILALLFKKPFILILPGSDLDVLVKSKKYYSLFKYADFIGLRGSNSINIMLKNNFDSKQLFVLNNVFEMQDYPLIKNIKKEFDIVVFSIIRKGKRIHLALDVVLRLKKYFPQIKCLILGDGVEKESVIKYANDLGLNDNLTFKGYHNNISYDLNRSKIFLMTTESEGLPMSMIEAMSCSLPVVVSDVNDICDVVKNEYNGYLVDPNKIDDYVSSCNNLLSNEKKLSLFSKNARTSIENLFLSSYSENAVKDTWDKIIKKCL